MDALKTHEMIDKDIIKNDASIADIKDALKRIELSLQIISYDKAGKAIISSLEKNKVSINDYVIIPDEISKIQNKIRSSVKNGISLVMITGGTGLSKRDVTPEAVRPLLDREIPELQKLSGAMASCEHHIPCYREALPV